MARFNFVAPGAAASGAMQQMIERMQAEQRQAALDKMAQERQAAELASRQAADARASEAADLNRTVVNSQLETQAATRQRIADEALRDRIGMLAPGAVLPADIAAKVAEQYPGMVRQETTSAEGSEAPIAGQEPPPMQSQTVFLGTPSQQAFQRVLSDPKLSDQQRRAAELAQATGDMPAALAQLLKEPENQTKPVFRRDREGTKIEQLDAAGQWVPHAGPLPKEHVLLEPRVSSEGGGGRSFVITQTTGEGVYTLDGRTGEVIAVRPNVLGAGAQADLTRGAMVQNSLDEVERLFDPSFVGPLAGRYKTMETLLTDNAANARLAEFQADVATLGNVLINLRTGAQMSDKEAQRILSELPAVSLPPATFIARLQKVAKDFRTYMRTRSRLGYGMTTPSDRQTMATEGRIPGVTEAPPRTTTPPPVATSTTPAPTAPTVKRYNPKTRKIE